MPYLNPPPLGTAAATLNAPELASGFFTFVKSGAQQFLDKTPE